MDFASLMSTQISKAKATSTSPTPDSKQQSKYVKRGEAEAAREAAYRAEQAAAQAAREERLAKKRKAEEEEAEKNREREEKRRRLAEESRKRREEEEAKAERVRRKKLGLPELSERKEEETPLAEGEEDVEDKELVTRLRAMGEPTRLFGESHRGRLRRFRRLEERARTPIINEANGPIPTILEPVEEKDMKVPAKPPADPDAKKFLFRQLASYFNMVLKEWQVALAQRSDEVKQSFSGRQATTAMTSTLTHLRPLFTKFERGDLEKGVLEPVVEIVHAAQERRYVDANDGYLRLSIGKAAWPIGVTMVGIHERSAREKLHESDKNQAHIMSDEITRKFLQGIKRCLSFAQTRWPPEDQGQLMG